MVGAYGNTWLVRMVRMVRMVYMVRMVNMVNIVLMAHGAYGAQSTYNAYPALVAIFATDHTPPLAHAQACERVDGLHGSLTPLLHVSHLRAKLRLGWGQGKG